MMLLSGLVALGTKTGDSAEEPGIHILAALPSEEELPKEHRELVQKLPKALLHRRSGSASQLVSSTTRCFCTVVAESDKRYYVAALRICLGQTPAEEVCVCFWSLHPEVVNVTFVKGLASLMASAIEPGSTLHDPHYLVQLWAWLLREVPLPPAACSLHLRAGRSEQPGALGVMALGCAAPTGCVPVPHVPLRFLVQQLSLSSLMQLLRLVLLERKVVLRSSSAFTLTACGEGITSLLIFPFRWQHSYLPVAPVQRELLQQTGPYVLGLHREVLELGGAALTALPVNEGSCPYSVFDLDVGDVEPEPAIARLAELPSSLEQKLRAGLSRLMANNHLDLGTTSPVRLGEGEPAFDREVQKVFFHSLAPLVTDLRQFYSEPEETASPGHFDVDGYVHSRDPEAQAFARALCETVAFRELLQEMMGSPLGESRLEKALVQEQLQPGCDVGDAQGRGRGELPTESFYSAARSSFASCPPDDLADVAHAAPGLTGAASLVLKKSNLHDERDAGSMPLELRLQFLPLHDGVRGAEPAEDADDDRDLLLAAWQRSVCANMDDSASAKAPEVPGDSPVVASLVAAMKAQANLAESGQGCRPRWVAGLRASMGADVWVRLSENQRELLDRFLDQVMVGEGEVRLEGAASLGKQLVSLVNVVPACFERLVSGSEAVAERLVESCDKEAQAEFEEVDAAETPVLNTLNRCVKTPRHPCLVAIDLLRRAFKCLHEVHAKENPRDTITRHTISDGAAMKRVRFSRTATGISVAPSEDGSPEHVSPLASNGRRARRSTTLASLSVSPSRSVGPRSPIAISPERSRKQGRSSDPNVLSSPTTPLSPSRPRDELRESSPEVTEVRRRFGELQACQPAQLTHEEKLAFWLNVLNASTLAWLCVVGVRSLHSNLFPMHVWISFLQRSLVNVGGQEFSLFEMEHTILRACSRTPKLGWFLQCQKGFKAGEPKAGMALAVPAPEVSFGIFYPFRFGCPPLRIFHPGLVREQLLLNCGQYLVDSLSVEDPPRRRVVLPPLLKYYGHDFGSSPASLVAFAQSVLEAVPSALDRLAQYSAVGSLDEKLGSRAPALAKSLERLRDTGGFASVAASFAEFDWRLDVPKAACFGRRTEPPSCPELEALLHQGGDVMQELPCLSWTLKPLLKEVRVAPPPGRPAMDRPDLARHRRYVAEGPAGRIYEQANIEEM